MYTITKSRRTGEKLHKNGRSYNMRKLIKRTLPGEDDSEEEMEYTRIRLTCCDSNCNNTGSCKEKIVNDVRVLYDFDNIGNSAYI